MIQKIRLSNDGVIENKRMEPFVQGQAKKAPAQGLSRLKQLIKTKKPDICVVRGEGIGDVLMTTPTVAALKSSFKEINISYATNTRYLNGALVKVLQYNPDIDEILERDLLDESRYDLVINLHCPAIWYEKPGNLPINRIDIFAKHAGVTLVDPTPSYYIQKDEVERANLKLRCLDDRKIIMVQPSASSEKRSLDHGKLKRALTVLGAQYNVAVLVLTHSSDFRTDVLWDNMPGARMLKDLDIREIAATMAHCDLVLCQDSSVLHLAGALGVPSVGLFGPTPPAARINHYKNTIAIWKGETLNPCPCWYQACPISQACWSMISEADIIQACVHQLKSTTRVDIPRLLSRTSNITISTELV